MPAECPSCGTELEERGPFTVCPNSFGCPAQLVGRIQHFGSRQALDIEGLGEETAKLLVEQELVRRVPDLFELTADQLTELEGFAELSANNLVAAIDRARSTELARFLHGLGIPEVGVAVARDLARAFGTMEALRAADEETLVRVDGVGPIMAGRIVEFFAEPHNAANLDRLLSYMRELTAPETAGRGRGAGREDLRVHRWAGGDEPRGREEARRGAGREGDRIGEQEDRLRGGGRGPGLEAGQGRVAGADGAGRGRIPGAAGGTGGRVMENLEIAAALKEMATLLEIKGGVNPFRIRAYRNAVHTIEEHPVPLRKLVDEGADLTELPAIGKDMASHIAELVTTGRLSELEAVADEVPRSLIQLHASAGSRPEEGGETVEGAGGRDARRAGGGRRGRARSRGSRDSGRSPRRRSSPRSRSSRSAKSGSASTRPTSSCSR